MQPANHTTYMRLVFFLPQIEQIKGDEEKMVARFKKVLKNQKGLTLIELLAVVVILGIISAIAVPSIGGLIDNTRKDAHVANAQQMISSAKLAVTGNTDLRPTSTTDVFIPLKYLIDEGYIDDMEDPDGGTYNVGKINDSDSGSYVLVSQNSASDYTYEVVLTNGERGILTPQEASELDRDDVVDVTS